MSHLFEDGGLGLAIETDKTVFSGEIDDALRLLDDQLRPLAGGAHSPSEVLADHRMSDIRDLAKDVLFKIIRLEARPQRATMGALTIAGRGATRIGRHSESREHVDVIVEDLGPAPQT